MRVICHRRVSWGTEVRELKQNRTYQLIGNKQNGFQGKSSLASIKQLFNVRTEEVHDETRIFLIYSIKSHARHTNYYSNKYDEK